MVNEKIKNLFRQPIEKDFFLKQGRFLHTKKLLLNCHFKKTKNKLFCEKVGKQLLIMPKKYNKIINKYLNLKKCKIHISYNNLIAIDNENSLVYRISFNKMGFINIKNNYDALKLIDKMNAPSPITIHYDDNVIITGETLLKGTLLTLGTTKNQTLIKIIDQLNIHYSKSVNYQQFNLTEELNYFDYLIKKYPVIWQKKLQKIKKLIHHKNSIQQNDLLILKAQIHGDLTFKNILINKKYFYFFDFDRSCISFAEFDIWLFYLHHLIYKQNPTYKFLLENIFQFINDKISITELDYFYKTNKKFKINSKIQTTLKYLFLYRMLLLSLQNFQKSETAPIKLLDFTITKLR